MSGDRIPDAPHDKDALRGFPHEVFMSGANVWRVHNAGRGPWFFGQTQRFSLDGAYGTCHVALEPSTAILETIVRGSTTIDAVELTVRRIRRLQLPYEYRLANLTAQSASGWGVTRKFGTDYPYDRCQAWASAFHSDGFSGLKFWANHDVTPMGVSLGLFGGKGERKGWKRGTAERLDNPYWTNIIMNDMGVSVLGMPHSSVLDIRDL